MAPLKVASRQGVATSGISYVFSFAVGVVVVNSFMLLMYGLFRVIYMKQHVPYLHLRVMAIPGSIAGILWSIGNYFSIYGVLYLGQSIAYPCVQTSLIVSGIWGIFYYKELAGKQIVIWICSAVVTLCGVVVLSLVHV